MKSPGRIALLTLVLATTALGVESRAEQAKTQLEWQNLPALPDDYGFGGPFVGTHNGALIVAGGANFPEGMPWEGGSKKWHDRVFVLASPNDAWQRAGKLPRRLAYGVSISTDAGLLLIGGEEDGQPVSDVYRLTWDAASRSVDFASLPPLPAAASYLSGAQIGDRVYVAASTRSPDADRLNQKFFWSLDLSNDDAAWHEEPVWPGPPRHKAVAAAQADGSGRRHFYLFSGSNPRLNAEGEPELDKFQRYVDAYRFDPDAAAWTRLADLPPQVDQRNLPGHEEFQDEGWPIIAATAVDVGQSHILVFSGSTSRYITLEVEERPLFPTKVLAYHTITDTWTAIGDMPQAVVTTTAAHWREQDGLIVVPSGEIKPGVRTTAVQGVRLVTPEAEFGAVNFSVLAIYLAGMLGVGLLFALRTNSTDDFFRGGQRVPSWVAGLSIFATMLSSITYVALPAKVFATDWLYYAAQLTVIPIALVVVYVAIPFFRKIDATSAYEYLELRFNRTVRLIGSAQFVLFQIGRMAIVMFLPALALAEITPLSVVECIVAMGVLSVIYCTLGGVEAVVWTDALQTIVLMGGLLAALVVVAFNVDGGIETIWTTAQHDGKLRLANLDFSMQSYTTTALWVVVMGMFFQSLYSYTSDQAIVQRYLTTVDEPAARRAMWTTAAMSVFGSLLFFVAGTALYVFYKYHPAELDLTMKTDAVFPLFISTRLPVGVAGLVVAGIFAAAQSTISTSMNSTATAIVTDFCVPFKVCKTDRGYLWLARFLTLLLGVLGTAVACLFALDKNIQSMVDNYMAMLGLFGGVLCGLFMLGMLTTRANAAGGLIGAVGGLVAVFSVKLYTDTNFFLYAMIATIVTFCIGYAASLITVDDHKDISSLTIHRSK